MKAAIFLVLAACGAPATSTPVATTPTTRSPVANPVDARAHICQRAAELAHAGCAPFNDMDASILADCSVADSLYIAGAQGCVDAAPDCDRVEECLVKAANSDAPYAGPTAACSAKTETPAGVSAADYAASYGRGDAHFADSPSTLGEPIEVCGMPAETAYLVRVACADGSHPFADRDAAASARTGNAGAGGRCGRIIDQYAVPCSETTYTVFIDPYRCPSP